MDLTRVKVKGLTLELTCLHKDKAGQVISVLMALYNKGTERGDSPISRWIITLHTSTERTMEVREMATPNPIAFVSFRRRERERGGGGGREGETDRQRKKKRETEREREKESQRDRQTDRQTETDRQTDRQRETDR